MGEAVLTPGSVVRSTLFGNYPIGIVSRTNSRENKYEVFYITDVENQIHTRTLRKEQMTHTGLYLDQNTPEKFEEINDKSLYNLIKNSQDIPAGGSRKSKRHKYRHHKKTNRRRKSRRYKKSIHRY